MFVAVLINCQAQKTRVYVVGTTHEERKYINSDTLVNILSRVKPDVILIELDSCFFNNKFKFDLNKYPDLLSTNENISANKYIQKYPKVKLRPFDISGRNEFYRENNYHKQEGQFFQEMLNMKANDEFSDSNKQLFDVALNILTQYAKAEITTLTDINLDVRDKFTELKYSTYDIFIQICKSEPKLYKWINFAELQRDFWLKRNQTMVENISNLAKQFENKTLVVFVGFEHRYFLINKLKLNKEIELNSENIF